MRASFLPWALAAGAIVAGCASPVTRYYTLADPAPAALAAPSPASATPIFFELAPLALPERLARPQMVVRQADDASAQVEVLEQHRWASSLENELRDALAAGIAARLGAVDVTRAARPGQPPAWRIAVQVHRFDVVEGRGADVALSWTLRRADDARTSTCQWAAAEPATGGIDALAQSARRLSTRAATAIASHLASAAAAPDVVRAACPAPMRPLAELRR